MKRVRSGEESVPGVEEGTAGRDPSGPIVLSAVEWIRMTRSMTSKRRPSITSAPIFSFGRSHGQSTAFIPGGDLANVIHVLMQQHYWEEKVGY
jgi:hypothetical protein